MNGNDRKNKNGDVHKPLTAMIMDAPIGKLSYILLTFITFLESSLGLSFRLVYEYLNPKVSFLKRIKIENIQVNYQG